jgi:anti-anti-sigma factor
MVAVESNLNPSNQKKLNEAVDSGLQLLSNDDLNPPTPCPDSWTFALYVQGKADEEMRRHVNEHIAFCKDCYQEYLALAEPEDILREIDRELEDPKMAQASVASAGTHRSGVQTDTRSSPEGPSPPASREVAGRLTVEIRTVEGVIVVGCVGYITYGAENSALRKIVKSLVYDRDIIVIDLKGVEYIDSAGIGTLAGLHTSAVSSGKSIVFVNPSGHIVDWFRRAELHGVLQIEESVNTVVAWSKTIRSRKA